MRTDEFDYALPESLIAQAPAEKRDASRMMVLHRAEGRIEHRQFSDLPDYLAAGDLLVLNDTRVIPARLFANKTREGTGGGKVEFLLLEELPSGEHPSGGVFSARWSALMRCRRRPKPGESVRLNDGETDLAIEEDLGEGKVVLRATGKRPFREAIAAVGIPPLPPYIHRKGATEEQRARDILRYQTIYAAHPGAVAAPTAGLHFTPGVFSALDAKGVGKAFVTLHVGIGTFRPVTAERVEDHRMEEERWTLPQETADAIRRARAAGLFTAAVVCNPGTPAAAASDVAVELATGPEIVRGSTRMKAGTAEKMVLNMISTAAMVRLGHVKGNRMIDMRPANRKLRERAEGMVMEAFGIPREAARARLDAAHGA